MSATPNPLGRWMSDARVAASLTRAALSVRVGVCERQAQRYELGQSMPRADVLARWCEVCGASLPEALASILRAEVSGA
jgi:transcriptional regulator with XRE-family HTH domain